MKDYLEIVLNKFGPIYKFINLNCSAVYFYAALIVLVAVFDGIIFGYIVPAVARDLFSESEGTIDGTYFVIVVVARALCSIIGVISAQQTQRLCYEAFSQFFWTREFLGPRAALFDRNLKLNTDHANGSARLALVVVNFIRLLSELLLAVLIVVLLVSQIPASVLLLIASLSPLLVLAIFFARSAAKNVGLKLTKAEWRKNALVADALNQKRSIFFTQLAPRLSQIFVNQLSVSSAQRFRQSLIPAIPKMCLELSVAGLVFIIWAFGLEDYFEEEIGLLLGAGVALVRCVPIATKITGSLIFLASEIALVSYFSNCFSEPSIVSEKPNDSERPQAQSYDPNAEKGLQKTWSVTTRKELMDAINSLLLFSDGNTGLLVALKGKSGWGKSLVLQELARNWSLRGRSVIYVSKQDGFLGIAPALNRLPLLLSVDISRCMPIFNSVYTKVRAQVGSHGVSTLSDGETAICLLARSLANSPSILLIDELFSSIDVEMRFEIRRELADFAKARCFFVIEVLHGSQDADAFIYCVSD